jgi:hypothetical protein
MSRHLSNERQECKTGHDKGRALVEGGGQMKRVKVVEYG